MLTKKISKKKNYILYVLITIIIISCFLFTFKITTLKAAINLKNEKISELTLTNSKLSEIKNQSNENQNTNFSDFKSDFDKISNRFVELYATYDINNLENKKSELLKIATEKVVNSIVPNDIIEDSKSFKNNTNTQKQIYSSDPTFKSSYDSSKIYVENVSYDSNKVNYFSIVKYKTKSSSGDSENTAYLSFTIEKNTNKTQIIDYQCYYLK